MDAGDAGDRLPLGIVWLRDADPGSQPAPGPLQGPAGGGQQPPVFRVAVPVHARRAGAQTRRAGEFRFWAGRMGLPSR